MHISKFSKEYTEGKGIYINDVWSEVKEFYHEIKKLNIPGILEELGDTILFIQLWLYSQYEVDGKIWGFNKNTALKFMKRKIIWCNIYEYVGLKKNISNYVGNYNKLNKVIKHLSNFNIDSKKAEAAFNSIVNFNDPRFE